MNAGGVLNTCKSNGKALLAGYSSGERVSNTWVICPALWDKPGKLGLIPYRTASWMVWWKAFAVWDEPAAYQLVGGVMAYQGGDGYPA